MKKRLFAVIGVLVVVLVVLTAFGLRRAQRVNSPVATTNTREEIETNKDLEAFDEDNAILEEISNDTSLDSIGKDLEEVSGEQATNQASGGVAVSSLETMGNDLSSQLDAFSSDLSDLEGVSNDTSLNGLDSDISGAIK